MMSDNKYSLQEQFIKNLIERWNHLMNDMTMLNNTIQ